MRAHNFQPVYFEARNDDETRFEFISTRKFVGVRRAKGKIHRSGSVIAILARGTISRHSHMENLEENRCIPVVVRGCP